MANRRTTTSDNSDPGPRGHEDTWGATEAAKPQWADKNAEQVREDVARGNEEKEQGNA